MRALNECDNCVACWFTTQRFVRHVRFAVFLWDIFIFFQYLFVRHLSSRPRLIEKHLTNALSISISVRTGKEPALRSFTEIQQLLQQGKKHIVKNILRENSWPINSPIRSQLWPILCAQHLTKQNMLDGFYWEMVHQVCESHWSYILQDILPIPNLFSI